jgi:FkbM family methyltransferase
VTLRGPQPRLDRVPAAVIDRVLLTVACRDADVIPKVERAGEVVDRDGVAVQVMHNGVVIEEGCYHGPWMTEIIRSLRGHHEPQEELVFDRILRRLQADLAHPPAMIEFGSFWGYYSLWFAHEFPAARIVALEPDPKCMSAGTRNFALNKLENQVNFVAGAIGSRPGEPLDFVSEIDGQVHRVVQHDLSSLMTLTDLDRIDLVLADVQGAETVLLERGRRVLANGRVRFLIVSTHHHSISGDPLTHQHALRLLNDLGAHVIAEHSVAESYSGDGLIAASFDARDEHFNVPISYARAKDSLFGELEPEIAAQMRRAGAAEDLAASVGEQLEAARQERDAARAERNVAIAELDAVRRTKLWRWAGPPRQVYGRLRSR